MKNIGLIIHAKADYGGVYQYSKSMADALSLNNEFNLILFTEEENDVRFDNYDCEIRKYSKPSYGISHKLISYLSLLSKYIRNKYLSDEEYKIFKDIDLFICPTPSFYPLYFLNTPFLFTLHDTQERYFPGYFSFREKLRRRLVNKGLSKTSAGIICESNSVKEDVKAFFDIKEEKIHVIQAPPPQKFLDYEFDDTCFEKVRNKYQLKQRYIFYPAHTWYHKNHIRLLEAFNLLKNKFPKLKLVLSGAKKNNFKKIKEKINEFNLNSRVIYLGYVDYEDLPYIYKMSEMLVMPTLFESISIPIYEAFSLKVPVCCSNVTGLPEQVGNAALIFDPYDIKDIAEKISELLMNEELATEIGKKGYSRITDMTHQEYARNLKSIISTVL